MKRIGVLGSGAVSATLANGLLKHGYAVMRGSRDPSKLSAWHTAAGPHASVGTFEETSRFGDLVILAVKGTAAEAVVESCAAHLIAKPVIDTLTKAGSASPRPA